MIAGILLGFITTVSVWRKRPRAFKIVGYRRCGKVLTMVKK